MEKQMSKAEMFNCQDALEKLTGQSWIIEHMEVLE